MNFTARIAATARKLENAANRLVQPTGELPEDSALHDLIVIDRRTSDTTGTYTAELAKAPYVTGKRFNAKAYAAYRANVQAAMNAHHNVLTRDYSEEGKAYSLMYNR